MPNMYVLEECFCALFVPTHTHTHTHTHTGQYHDYHTRHHIATTRIKYRIQTYEGCSCSHFHQKQNQGYHLSFANAWEQEHTQMILSAIMEDTHTHTKSVGCQSKQSEFLARGIRSLLYLLLILPNIA